jgi:putative flavoprotein involved in K+ transport
LAAPVREGVAVKALKRAPDGGFALTATDGPLETAAVVVATGAYQRAHRPEGATTLPEDLVQLDVEQFRDEATLPPGKVLIVGSGQSGCQIAEELRAAGREVYLSCGRAPWAPRRIDGRDLFWWITEGGFMDQALSDLPSPAARLFSNPQATGHEGGHDLHFRTLRAAGVTLLGHFLGAQDRRARFARDLGASVSWGDDRYRDLRELFRRAAERHGLAAPNMPEPAPFDPVSPEELDLDGFGAVLFAGGFRPDYARWIEVPEAFDDLGFPLQVDGVSIVTTGLYFVGVHFLRTRKSSLLSGVGEDAALVAEQVAGAGRR